MITPEQLAHGLRLKLVCQRGRTVTPPPNRDKKHSRSKVAAICSNPDVVSERRESVISGSAHGRSQQSSSVRLVCQLRSFSAYLPAGLMYYQRLCRPRVGRRTAAYYRDNVLRPHDKSADPATL